MRKLILCLSLGLFLASCNTESDAPKVSIDIAKIEYNGSNDGTMLVGEYTYNTEGIVSSFYTSYGSTQKYNNEIKYEPGIALTIKSETIPTLGQIWTSKYTVAKDRVNQADRSILSDNQVTESHNDVYTYESGFLSKIVTDKQKGYEYRWLNNYVIDQISTCDLDEKGNKSNVRTLKIRYSNVINFYSIDIFDVLMSNKNIMPGYVGGVITRYGYRCSFLPDMIEDGTGASTTKYSYNYILDSNNRISSIQELVTPEDDSPKTNVYKITYTEL
ncbi:MAG: hypothetical protein PHR45_01740 [Muribaculaceae bacterium]|nr:hypothetical protein [Muribaculaceae bacterium]